MKEKKQTSAREDYNKTFSLSEGSLFSKRESSYRTNRERHQTASAAGFQGYLVPNSEFEALDNENNKHKSEVQELKGNLKTRDAEIDALRNENQHVEKIKLTVESSRTILKALRGWTNLQYNEKIHARVSKKFNSIAAGTYDLLDFIYRKLP